MQQKDIATLQQEIVETLRPLEPEGILLFGSYAYGTPSESSDIDLFLIKEIEPELAREFKVKARLLLHKLIKKYKIGFDILVGSKQFIESRQDYFYKTELMQKAKVLL